MSRRIVVLSGRVGVGKSALAAGLEGEFSFVRMSTRNLLIKRLGEGATGRRDLQAAGAELDIQTRGRWVCDQLAQELHDHPDTADVVVDAVRITPQIEALREAYGPSVVHVHLTATEAVLEARYTGRDAAHGGELPTYADVGKDPTEAGVDALAAQADVVVETDRCLAPDVLARTASKLGLCGGARDRLVDVLVGGQYGSEGKGNVAFHLAPGYEILVRVGGPNAGHSVMDWTGNKYTHHQLPSGTRNSSAHLVIGPGATLRLEHLLEEIAQCGVERDRLSIDPSAMIITAEDIEAEVKLRKGIGSTGQGGGAAMARKISHRGPTVKLARDYDVLRPFLAESAVIFDRAFRQGSRVFVEGTQGTTLSLHHGPYPYVTSRDTTASGCLAESGLPPGRVRRVIMTCRTYPIRVESPKGGTSGPMAKEISWDVVAERSGLDPNELKAKERTSTTNRARRVAEFDWGQLRRSALLNSPTDIALTFVDYIDRKNVDARRFEQLTPETIQFVEEVEMVAQAPVTLIATRFHSRSVIDRRTW